MPTVAILALASWLVVRSTTGGSNTSTTSTSQLVAATSGTMSQTVTATGTIAAADTDDLSFSSSGKVTAVNVAAGDKVKAGQVLATIDSSQLQASVSTAESTLAQAQAQLSDDESSGASSAQLSADSAKVQSAQDALTTAQQNLAGAQLVATFDGTVSAVNLTVGEQLGSSGGGGTGQTGSGSGSGGNASVPSGSGGTGGNGGDSSTGSSTAQIQVISTGKYSVQLAISDLDVKNLAVGQTANVSLTTGTAGGGAGGFARRFFDAGGAAFGGGQSPQSQGASRQSGSGSSGSGSSGTGSAGSGASSLSQVAAVQGKVTSVGRVASATSGVSSYPVVVEFSTTSGEYNPGATASVSIVYKSIPNAVQVPVTAVSFSSSGSSTVTVDDNGKRSTRTVQTGITSGGMIQITSGLQAGEEVVVTGRTAGAVPTRSNGGPANFTTAGGN
jgi:macrolide-specific efflux system membrane fusion protein